MIYDEAENKYVFSMENGYAIPTLASLRRGFDCLSDGITMIDEYEFTETPQSVVERFVSCVEITVDGDGAIKCGDTELIYDKEKYRVSISKEQIRRAPGSISDVWLLDLSVISPEEEMTLTFKFI